MTAVVIMYYIDAQEPQLPALSRSFVTVARRHGLSVPDDFCECSLRAMTILKESGRSNVLYQLARALSTPRSDGKGSKFPTDRMPMGLLEYMTVFFNSELLPQVW